MAIKPNAREWQAGALDAVRRVSRQDGEGLKRADGGVIYPPLRGNDSFNIGAGMARTYTAAAFVKRNMPIGLHDKFPLGQGGLSDQDAIDVAEYFAYQPHGLPDKEKDWPRDKKTG